MDLIVNIDVPQLQPARDFYCHAFGLTPGRRLGDDALELTGGPVAIWLLARGEGTVPARGAAHLRSYSRHWSPVHLDFVVPDLDAARQRVLAAGATEEEPVATFAWGKLGLFADPFGHGFCLVQFLGRGYDEVAS